MSKINDSIEKELNANIEELKEVIPKQLAFADSVGFYLQNDSVSIREIISEKVNGLKLPTLKNATWNAIMNSNAQLFEFETVSTLTEIKEQKRFLEVKTDKLMDYLLLNLEKFDESSKTMIIMHLYNVIDSENALVEVQEGYLKEE